MPKASVIISVYNNLRFLELVIAGLEMQTEKDFEVIISDDGSGEEFMNGVKALINQSALSIKHNWHEDKGFRKNKILNKSIVLASAPYLIFLDGDCIPHPNFIDQHLENSEQHICLAGRRVDLSENITKELNEEMIRSGEMQKMSFTLRMFSDFLQSKLYNFKYGIYFTNAILRKFFNRKEKGLLGANFSVYKEDILAINGFDERYSQPTFGEDSDVEFRLRLNGVNIKTVINTAVVYHCYHKLLPRPIESKQLYEMVVTSKIAYTPFGINRT